MLHHHDPLLPSANISRAEHCRASPRVSYLTHAASPLALPRLRISLVRTPCMLAESWACVSSPQAARRRDGPRQTLSGDSEDDWYLWAWVVNPVPIIRRREKRANLPSTSPRPACAATSSKTKKANQPTSYYARCGAPRPDLCPLYAAFLGVFRYLG